MKTLDQHLREAEESCRQYEADVREALEMIVDPKQLKSIAQDYAIGVVWIPLAKAFALADEGRTIDPIALATCVREIRDIFVDNALHEINRRRND